MVTGSGNVRDTVLVRYLVSVAAFGEEGGRSTRS